LTVSIQEQARFRVSCVVTTVPVPRRAWLMAIYRAGVPNDRAAVMSRLSRWIGQYMLGHWRSCTRRKVLCVLRRSCFIMKTANKALKISAGMK